MRKRGLLVIVFFLFLFLLTQSIHAQTWQSLKRLSWNPGWSYDPAVATDISGNIHVVWEDNTPGNWEIYYKRSTDGGLTWTTKRLTWTARYSQNPAIAIDSSGNIHVVWQDNTSGNYEIYYKRSTDGGTTWQPPKRLTWSSGDSENPAIAIDSSGNIHVVWEDDTHGNYEIYYKRSTDGGSTWNTQRLTWNYGNSVDPAIAIDSSGNIHVVWANDQLFYDYEIYYKRSKDGGTTWQPPRRLTWNSYDTYDPAIAIDSSGNIHVVWEYYTSYNNYEIYYKMSTDGGSIWQPTKRITWNTSNSYDPAIAIDSSGNIHVVWHDYTPGNSEIYYKRSTDCGLTWTTQRLTWSSGDSYDPVIAIDSSGNIHVVWYDATPGITEIYYKKGK